MSREPSPQLPVDHNHSSNDSSPIPAQPVSPSVRSSGNGVPSRSPVSGIDVEEEEKIESPIHPTPVTRQSSEREEGYPSWLPKRPPPPAPTSTVPSLHGALTSTPTPGAVSPTPPPIPRRVSATGRHRASESYDTGYTGYSGYTGFSEDYDYVDLDSVNGGGVSRGGGGGGGGVEVGEEEEEDLGGEGYEMVEGNEGVGDERRRRIPREPNELGIGRRQTPRSVRIVSVGHPMGLREGAGVGGESHRNRSNRHHHRRSSASASASGKRDKALTTSGVIPDTRAWWRDRSTPLAAIAPAPSPLNFLPITRNTAGAVAETEAQDARRKRTRIPRFRAPNLHPELLRSPSTWMHIWFVLWPIVVFGPVLVQTFLDFNVVFCLVQVAIHPTPAAPGVSGTGTSGHNWALGAAAYAICWGIWIFGVILMYDIVYCFWRRWRIKRPLLLPLYLSSAGFNFVCMTSYVNFCFMQHIRASARPEIPFLRAFKSTSSASTVQSVISARTHTPTSGPETASAVAATTTTTTTSTPFSSWRDYFAETFYFYSQNFPSIILLIPRAALTLSILLAYSHAQPEDIVLQMEGQMERDLTFFRSDGSLSGYARGVLWSNVGFVGLRVLGLFVSWIGLWIFSGQACGGICGPRYRWEEPDEKGGFSGFSGGGDEDVEVAQDVVVSWAWRECTRERVQDAYDFCIVSPVPDMRTHAAGLRSRDKEKEPEEGGRRSGGDDDGDGNGNGGNGDDGETFEGLDRVLAAAGLATIPSPARRGVLRGELFETPPELTKELPIEDEEVGGLAIGLPVASSPTWSREGRGSREGKRSRDKTPPSSLSPYPFTGYPAQTSSEDPLPVRIPFPPSPTKDEHDVRVEVEEGERVEDEEDEDEVVEDEELLGEEYDFGLEEPSSSGRASGSMSSLGHQIPSRFPFQFRHISRRSRGGRSSVGTVQSKSGSSNITGSNSNTRNSQSISTPERQSRAYSSPRSVVTTNRDSVDSPGPWSSQPHRSHSPQSPQSPQSLQSPQSPQSPTSPREIGGSEFSSPTSTHLESPIPQPPRAARRRERHSLPGMSLPPSFTGFVLDEPRVRAQSASTTASGPASHTFGPQPMYESDSDDGVGRGGEEDDDVGMMTDPEPDGSQEEAEREDGVALLTGATSGRSPRSSLGNLRSRSNLSLTNLNLNLPNRRSRSRHSSATSSHARTSISGSKSGGSSSSGSLGGVQPSARSRSVSASASAAAAARSRAQSLIQSISGGSRSSSSISLAMRSRANSMARLSEIGTGSPRLSVGSGAGSAGVASVLTGSNSGSGSGSGSRSHMGMAHMEDYTFGQPIVMHPPRVDSPFVEEEVSLHGSDDDGEIRAEDDGGVDADADADEGQKQVENSTAKPEAVQDVEQTRELRKSFSNLSSHVPSAGLEGGNASPSSLDRDVPVFSAPSSSSQPIPTASHRLQEGRSIISSADESLITRPTSQDDTSDTVGRTPSSYGTAHFIPEHIQQASMNPA